MRAAIRFPAMAAAALLVAACATSPQAPGSRPAAPYQETVLITGANRGIGLEFARQFAERGWRVIATARDPEKAADLRTLAAADRDVRIERLDVTAPVDIEALADALHGAPIDLLLLNAALGPDAASALSPLARLTVEDGLRSFDTNALGPLRVARALMDNVAASRRRLLVAMGTDSGSFGAGVKKPILYHYKASKTALHMYMRTLSFEAPERGITVVILHPGLVATSPALARFPGALQTGDSVGQMMRVIEGLDSTDNGRFIDYRGQTMPW